MQSHEVLKRAADRVGVKSLAGTLRLSPALIYKWCQETNPADPDASGARNPLDRLADIVEATSDHGVLSWLCHEAGGFFVRNPASPPENIGAQLLLDTQRVVNQFSHLLAAVSKSIEDDGEIDPAEADRIRSAWEQLKGTVETFTVSCERGTFHHGGAEA